MDYYESVFLGKSSLIFTLTSSSASRWRSSIKVSTKVFWKSVEAAWWNCLSPTNWWRSLLATKTTIGTSLSHKLNTRMDTHQATFQCDYSGKFSTSSRSKIRRNFYCSWLEVIAFRYREWRELRWGRNPVIKYFCFELVYFQIFIQPINDDNMLCVAHTCFNLLGEWIILV